MIRTKYKYKDSLPKNHNQTMIRTYIYTARSSTSNQSKLIIMTIKIAIFYTLFLFSSVLCNKDIDINYDSYINNLLNLEKLKTKIKANLGDTEEAAWATIQSK